MLSKLVHISQFVNFVRFLLWAPARIRVPERVDCADLNIYTV